MADLRFASWVEPLASQMRKSRNEVLEFALAREPAFWAAPSVVSGWSNRDLLAHIGRGNDQMLQDVLRLVASRADVPAAVLEPDTDAENERRVAARRSWPIERVIDELRESGEEMQSLLAGLGEPDAQLQPGGASWDLRGLMRLVMAEDHDGEHLAQLRESLTALGPQRRTRDV